MPLTTLTHLFQSFQNAFRAGDLDTAEQLVAERIALLTGAEKSPADSPDLARAYTNLGLIEFFRRNYAQAETHLAAALAMSRRLNDARGIARDMGNLALVPEALGDLARAEDLYRAALDIAERIGDNEIAAGKLANLGDIALRRGRNEDARELWTRALVRFERLGETKHAADLRDKLARPAHHPAP